MDPTICSILRPLRSWASSPSLSPRVSGRGGRQLKVPVPRDDLVPFGETIGSATTHHGFVSSLRPPALSPSLSRTGKPRPTGPFQALHPGTLLPGPYFPGPAWARRPSGPLHFADKLFLQVFLIYAKFFILLFYMNMSIGTGTLPFPPYSLHDAASCRLAPTDAPYPPSDSLELDPRAALGQHGPVLPFRSCSSCGSFSFQI